MNDRARGSRADESATDAPAVSLIGVLRRRNMRLFFVGGTLNHLGMWCFNIAAGLIVYDLTRSTLLVGAINFSQFAGTVLLAPWAGGAADRFDRRRLLMAMQVVAAVVVGSLGLLTALGLVSAGLVVLTAAVFGLSLAFSIPALQALVPLLVDDHELDSAVAINGVMFNLARALGPVVGALVADWLGYASVFVLTTLASAAFLFTLLLVRPRPQRRRSGAAVRFRASLRSARERPRVVAMLVVAMGVSVSADPSNTLAPELVRDVFGERDLYVGLFAGAFGVGAVLAALTLARLLRGRRRVLVAAMVVQGVGVVGVGVAPNIHIAMLAIAVSGAGFLTALTRSVSRLHVEIDDEERGRVMALWSLAFLGTRPLAALADGVVAELAGVRVAAVVMAVPVLLAALWVRRLLPPITVDSLPGVPASDAPLLVHPDDD